MEPVTIAAMATQLAQARTANEVQTTLFRKALDLNEQAALQLINGAAQVGRANPPHLGNQIDTFA